MSTHQKPNDPKSKGNQKRHNSATRGVNTTKMGALWARRWIKVKRDGETITEPIDVRVPPRSLYDPDIVKRRELPEPFDAIKLNWAEEVVDYLAENPSYKLTKEQLDNGSFEYQIRDGSGDVVFAVISRRNAFLNTRQRRTKRRKRKK